MQFSNGPMTAEELGDLEACRGVLLAFFRALDGRRYDALGELVTSGFTLELLPDGPVVTGLEEVLAFVRRSHGDDWHFRVHINHNLLVERVDRRNVVATATCFHHLIHDADQAAQPFPGPDSVSEARYELERGEDGGWRLARRTHRRIAPVARTSS